VFRVLGITSSQLAGPGFMTDEMGYEIYRLMEEGRKLYHEVVLINPARLVFIFSHLQRIPVAMTENTDLSRLSTLIVRKTNGYEEPLSLLAKALRHNGCDLIDPPERFSGSPAGKLMESLKGFISQFSPDTFIAFNRDDALRLAGRLNSDSCFPLIGKPNRGSRGENVSLLRNLPEAILYINNFFSDEKYSHSALLLQSYISVKKEYRVMVLDGQCLGMAEKIVKEGQAARNAAQGGQFIAAHDEEVIEFTLQHTSRKGILGADVVRDDTGRLFLLEANRAPQWYAFERATGINVASFIIQRAWQRILFPNDLIR
jgi:glutathione synthase/RimK-type ligase-like ATP-grasp enzyme